MNNWKKTFAIIWTGQLFSILTSVLVNFAIILWISFETRSAEVLAWATIAALLPQSILGLFTGVFIDRWSRKAIMILSDSFIALCTFIIAVLFYLEIAELWHIYLLLGFRSVGSAFHAPSMQASIPLLAPDTELMRIAGINQSINSVCQIAGPALAALLIGIMDITYILLLDVAGAAIACTSLLFVSIPNPVRKTVDGTFRFMDDIKDGFRAITGRKGILWLTIFSLLTMLVVMPVGVLFPLMTINYFSGNALQVSLIETAWGVGMLFGGVMISIRQYKANKVLLINVMYLILGIALLISGMLPPTGFILFALFAFMEGAAATVYQSSFTTILQQQIDASLLGRVFSVYGSIILLPSIAGLLCTGFIADNIGINNAFIISGALLALIGTVAFFVPVMIRVDNPLTN